MSVHACMTHPCPVCMSQTSPVIADTVLPNACWLNEDCIAGHHMDEIPCRFDDDVQHCDGCTCRPAHEARPAHPLTQIGRTK